MFPPHVHFHVGYGGSVQQMYYRGARIYATLFFRNHYKIGVKNIPFIPTCRNGSFSSSWYTIIALMELIWFLRRNLSWVCIFPSNFFFFFKMFKRQPSMLTPVKNISRTSCAFHLHQLLTLTFALLSCLTSGFLASSCWSFNALGWVFFFLYLKFWTNWF